MLGNHVPSSLTEHQVQAPTAPSAEWKWWAAQICTAWQKTVESIIETGCLLIEARAELPHGSFELMVQRELPFSPRAARMLMKIAEHPVISNRKHVSVLPSSWGTLYQLALLPAPLCQDYIDNGSINPKMERKHATALKPQSTNARRKRSTYYADVARPKSKRRPNDDDNGSHQQNAAATRVIEFIVERLGKENMKELLRLMDEAEDCGRDRFAEAAEVRWGVNSFNRRSHEDHQRG